MPTKEELANAYRAKHNAYYDVDDNNLVDAILQKYPEYKNQLDDYIDPAMDETFSSELSPEGIAVNTPSLQTNDGGMQSAFENRTKINEEKRPAYNELAKLGYNLDLNLLDDDKSKRQKQVDYFKDLEKFKSISMSPKQENYNTQDAEKTGNITDADGNEQQVTYDPKNKEGLFMGLSYNETQNDPQRFYSFIEEAKSGKIQKYALERLEANGPTEEMITYANKKYGSTDRQEIIDNISNDQSSPWAQYFFPIETYEATHKYGVDTSPTLPNGEPNPNFNKNQYYENAPARKVPDAQWAKMSPEEKLNAVKMGEGNMEQIEEAQNPYRDFIKANESGVGSWLTNPSTPEDFSKLKEFFKGKTDSRGNSLSFEDYDPGKLNYGVAGFKGLIGGATGMIEEGIDMVGDVATGNLDGIGERYATNILKSAVPAVGMVGKGVEVYNESIAEDYYNNLLKNPEVKALINDYKGKNTSKASDEIKKKYNLDSDDKSKKFQQDQYQTYKAGLDSDYLPSSKIPDEVYAKYKKASASEKRQMEKYYGLMGISYGTEGDIKSKRPSILEEDEEVFTKIFDKDGNFVDEEIVKDKVIPDGAFTGQGTIYQDFKEPIEIKSESDKEAAESLVELNPKTFGNKLYEDLDDKTRMEIYGAVLPEVRGGSKYKSGNAITSENFKDTPFAPDTTELKKARALAPQMVERLELKQKYPGITDDLLDKILADDNPQRKAEVIATIDEAFKMMEKGKGTDEIIETFKNTTRTKQASGGLTSMLGE